MIRFLLATLFLCGTTFAIAGSSKLQARIADLSDQTEARVIGWRRNIHQHPELAFQETRTAGLVAEHLRSLQFDEVLTGVGETGVVGILRGSKPGPVVALRADMDALPIQESTGLPFASRATARWQGREVPVMHACGHDAHVAILMGVASVLAALREDLPGTAMLIFQPAEEGSDQGGGAEAMLVDGLFATLRPEAIFGLHVGPSPLGTVLYRSGPTAAAADEFFIDISGEGTHGAMPWGGSDSLSAAAQTVLGLQSIVSRRLDITRVPAIVSVGTLQAGTRSNVIPVTASLSGTVRSFDEQQRQQIHALIETIASNAANSYGARAQTRIRLGYPVLINDPDLGETMLPALRQLASGQLHTTPMLTVAEDFAYFAQQVPGMYIVLGAMPPDVTVYNHSPNFTIDERALKIGVRVLGGLAVDFLNQWGQH